jgi:hypothetical protein
MLRTALTTAAAAALALVGLVHGQWTGRWQTTAALDRAVAALGRVPEAVGDWEGAAVDMDPTQFAKTGAAGYLVRRYTNRVTGRAVSVMIVCGRPGPVAVHTPDVCYSGTGYALTAPPVKLAVGGGAEFWTARFRRRDVAAPDGLQLYWGWRTPDGNWSASDNPRWEFARAPALCKLYVIRDPGTADERPEDDPAIAFLTQLLPQLAGAFTGPS